jgi:hypothetical protein
MWNEFSIYPLIYSLQLSTFELIEYVNCLFWSSPIFQANDPKVHLGLNDFPSFSKLTMQKLQIQFSQPTMCFYWNEKLDSTLMDILKNNQDTQLQYVVCLFNFSCNTIMKKYILFNIYKK